MAPTVEEVRAREAAGLPLAAWFRFEWSGEERVTYLRRAALSNTLEWSNGAQWFRADGNNPLAAEFLGWARTPSEIAAMVDNAYRAGLRDGRMGTNK